MTNQRNNESFRKRKEYQNGNIIFTQEYNAETGQLRVSEKLTNQKKETIYFCKCPNQESAIKKIKEIEKTCGLSNIIREEFIKNFRIVGHRHPIGIFPSKELNSEHPMHF